MKTYYLFNNASASVELQIPQRPVNSVSHGLSVNYFLTAEFHKEIRARFTKSEPFIKGNSVFDESRWLALYCATHFYTLNILLIKTGLNERHIENFCAHYGIDFKTRKFFQNGGAK